LLHHGAGFAHGGGLEIGVLQVRIVDQENEVTGRHRTWYHASVFHAQLRQKV